MTRARRWGAIVVGIAALAIGATPASAADDQSDQVDLVFTRAAEGDVV